WIEAGVTGSYANRDYSGRRASIMGAEETTPYGVMYRDSLGNLEKYPYTQSQINPLWGVNNKSLIEDLNIDNDFRVKAHMLLHIPFIKGFSYRLNLQFNHQIHSGGSFAHEGYYVQEGEGLQGRYDPASIQKLLTLANGSLNGVTN